MILKLVDGVPGGRVLVFLFPLVLFGLGLLCLTVAELIQITNGVTLGLAVAVTYAWRRSVWIFLREKEDAAAIWLSLGLFSMVAITVLNVGYSTWVRSFGTPLDPVNSSFVAGIKFGYAFSFGSLYLVPFATASMVPPPGWVSLLAVVAVSAGLSLALMRIF